MSSSNKKATDRAALAAQMRAEQARRETLRRFLAIGGVALAFILIVGGAVVYSVVKNNHDNNKIAHEATKTTGQYGVVIGPKSAPHKVVIYEDFLCPFCGALENGSHAELAKLASEGKVQVDYRPFDLLGRGDPNSYSVRSAGAFSIVLEKSGKVVAKKFHDILYANRPDEGGPFPSDADLVKEAVEAGADEAQVEGPIESHAGEAWVTAATKAAFATGLTGTPTIIVDGKVLQNGGAADLLAAVQ